MRTITNIFALIYNLLIVAALALAVIFLGPVAYQQYDSWSCQSAKLRCAVERPDVFFGTKQYPSGFDIIEGAVDAL